MSVIGTVGMQKVIACLFIQKLEIRGTLVFDILDLVFFIVPVVVLLPLFVIFILVVGRELKVFFLLGFFAICVCVSEVD